MGQETERLFSLLSFRGDEVAVIGPQGLRGRRASALLPLNRNSVLPTSASGSRVGPETESVQRWGGGPVSAAAAAAGKPQAAREALTGGAAEWRTKQLTAYVSPPPQQCAPPAPRDLLNCPCHPWTADKTSPTSLEMTKSCEGSADAMAHAVWNGPTHRRSDGVKGARPAFPK